MPYRIDVLDAGADALDRLVDAGALDVVAIDGGLAAIMPDSVAADSITRALGGAQVRVRPARGRDEESVWVIDPRPVSAGRFRILPADRSPEPDALRLTDGDAFGTGLHPTTALCLEILDDEVSAARPARVLDVGTGSGVLALAALVAGVPRATAVDVEGAAIRVAAENAQLNGFTERLELVHGGPGSLAGTWPLVLANILSAPLIEMAPALARRVASKGRLVLSGIRSSLASDVEQAYVRQGMRQVDVRTREGWTALTLHACW